MLLLCVALEYKGEQKEPAILELTEAFTVLLNVVEYSTFYTFSISVLTL